MIRQVLRKSIASEGTDQLLSRVKQALPQLDSDRKKHQKSRSLISMEMKYKLLYQYDSGFDRFCSFLLCLFDFWYGTFERAHWVEPLDRLLATPVKRSEIVYGYMLSYGIIAIFQTAVVVLAAIWLLDVEVVGNILNVIIVNVVLALVALALEFSCLL